MLKYLVLLVLLIGTVSAAPVYIAQGDPAYIRVQHSGGTCWYFPPDYATDNHYYDLPSKIDGDRLPYCDLNSSQSGSMQKGGYTLLYVYPAFVRDKFLKDVSWKDGSIVSVFAVNAPLDERGVVPSAILADVKKTIAIMNIDRYEEFQLEIQAPALTITRLESTTKENVIRISGTTNFKDGDPVRIVVDESDHYAKKDLANFTFSTRVSRWDSSMDGTFTYDMYLPLNEMAPIWHTVSVYVNDLVSTARFPVYQIWKPLPTPTQYINYFGNGTIKPDIVTVEVTVVKERTVIVTPTPTPVITDVFGDVLPAPAYSEVVIPPQGIVLLLMLCAVVVLFKGGKK